MLLHSLGVSATTSFGYYQERSYPYRLQKYEELSELPNVLGKKWELDAHF
jgi:hypothetical protein